jgi:endonuclease/exonuclease/phosphatase family metal-dependent hydrolase
MQLRLATLNTQNLGHTDPGWRLRGLAEALVGSLEAPDLICLQEICGSDPPDASGRIGAGGTLAAIGAAMGEVGGPEYRFLECPPLPGEQGGKLGADIRTCLAYRPDRLCPTPVARLFSEVAAASDVHLPLGGEQPAFTGDRQRGWAPSRRPIAASFGAAGRDLVMIGCHLKSMRAPSRASALQFKAQRVAQGEYLGHLARRLAAEQPQALLVIAGDLNDTPGSSTLATICGESLADPGRRLPPRRRYTAVHDKGRVTLDYLLLSRWAEPAALQQVPHLNTGIAPPVRFSDHDPVLVELPWPRPEHAGI